MTELFNQAIWMYTLFFKVIIQLGHLHGLTI